MRPRESELPPPFSVITLMLLFLREAFEGRGRYREREDWNPHFFCGVDPPPLSSERARRKEIGFKFRNQKTLNIPKESHCTQFIVSSDNVYYRFSCHRYTEPLTKHLRHSLPIKIPRASGAMTERHSRTDGQVRPDNGTATRGIQHFAPVI
ncbi:hypothetical protein TNCV_103891 [Trichonephila clavipes]|nr:hypothetical protein TNCV_103891 [Trichonephila clavipes]